MRIATWNVCILYRGGAMNELAKYLEKYVLCKKLDGQESNCGKNRTVIYVVDMKVKNATLEKDFTYIIRHMNN
jgi:hypothetical protein